MSEILKFKMNCRIENHLDKISRKDKVIIFNENISLLETTDLRDLYIQKREDDGWMYLEFLVDGYNE